MYAILILSLFIGNTSPNHLDFMVPSSHESAVLIPSAYQEEDDEEEEEEEDPVAQQTSGPNDESFDFTPSSGADALAVDIGRTVPGTQITDAAPTSRGTPVPVRPASVGGPLVPVEPQPIPVCADQGDGTFSCYFLPPELVGPDGAEGGNIPEGGLLPADPADPADPVAPYVPSAAEIEGTILRAYNSTPFTDFDLKTAPPGDLEAPLITQLETFLWVDEAEWRPVSASASIPGYLTVTITAVPVKMVWSGGESGDISCVPPGVPWSRGASSDCMMTYKSSSATNEHTLTLSTTWDIAFTCSAYCSGGALPAITRDNTRSVRVAEIQSIVTSSG